MAQTGIPERNQYAEHKMVHVNTNSREQIQASGSIKMKKEKKKMGHCISYLVFPKNTTEKELREAGSEFAFNNADRQENPYGIYDNRLTVHRDKVYENRDAAERAINAFDNGCYDDHAVLFQDLSSIKSEVMDKKIAEINGKIRELATEREAYKKLHSIKTFKSKQVGCQKCGSKLTIEYLKWETCPVCNQDLRGKTTLETIERFNERIRQQEEKRENVRQQYASKAQIMMLCKFEVHC